MKLEKVAGATSEIWQVFIQDSTSTTGAGLTGLVFNSGSLTAYFHRDTDTTATAITLVTMTVGTFTSSGFKEIDATHMPGWYQLCPPNAALAAGAKSVAIHLQGASNMAPCPIEVQLTTFDVDANVAATIWQDTTSGHFTVASSIGNALYAPGPALSAIRQGTATAGASSTITLDSGASATNSFYNFTRIYLTGGTGVGQVRTITGYVGSSKVATVSGNWTTNPDATTTFAILPETVVILGSDGLDQISVADPGAPSAMTSLPKMMVAIWRSIFKKSTLTTTQLKNFADDGSTVNATATVSDDGTTQTKGAAS